MKVAKILVFSWVTISVFNACNLYEWQQKRIERKMENFGVVKLTTITSKGQETCYQTKAGFIQDSKPTLLLIHGYHGGGLDQWAPNIPTLSEHFNIVAPDLNYHGNTYFESDYSIEMQVDLVKRFLDANSNDCMKRNLIVVGSSYGGMVSARFCEKFAGLVQAYVSYDGLSGCFSRNYTDSIAQQFGIPNATELLNPQSVRNLKILAGLQTPVHAPNFVLKIALENHFKKNRNEKIQLLNYLEKNQEQFSSHKFNWPMPVYILWGENDKIISKESVNCLQKIYAIPDEHISVVPKTGHIMNMEKPDFFNQWLIDRFSRKP
jgi:pimeloyl-ACP methyl ester carboxylesterase